MTSSDIYSFRLEKTVEKARAGVLTTPHGVIRTPMFMPVATAGTLKSLDTADIHATQAQIILGNTYHLFLRPGTEVLSRLGGMHGLMGWRKPILTDSGGFQVLSLGDRSVIRDDGVEFRSHLDGSKHFFTPARALEIQAAIGADICMVFDECTPDDASYDAAARALERTKRWSQESKRSWDERQRLSVFGSYQALFGIVQGGLHPQLRTESAQFLVETHFDGYAVGGETIGYNRAGTAEVMGWIEHILPTDAPRYAMGVGLDPVDIIQAISLGFDMFDCVAPTRLARNGALYVGELVRGGAGGIGVFESEYPSGRLSIGRSEMKYDARPIQDSCDCATCRAGYSRAYLHHLYKSRELSYYRLASIHNVRFMVRLTEHVRQNILTSGENT